MYNRLYRFWMPFVVSCWLTTAAGVIPTRADLFKPSEERITQKLNYLMAYARTTDNKGFASLHSSLRDAVASETLDALVNLYKDQYATKQVVSTADNAYGTDVSFMILILEKMVSVYYCKLDMLESACHYWEWATNHPTAYAASQSPYRWVTGGSFMGEAERNYAYAQQLRDQYSEEYGAVERLLGAMADGGFINPERWLHDVHAFLIGILTAVNPEQSNDDLRVIAQKVVLYEKRMASEVAVVKVPHWINRNWLALTAAAATAGITAYWCYNNASIIQNMYQTSEKALSNFWENTIEKPVNNLKNELKQASKPISSTAGQLDKKALDDSLDMLQKTAEKSKVVYYGLGKDTNDALFEYLRKATNDIHTVASRINDLVVQHNITSTLLKLAVPYLFAKVTYQSGAAIYNWFTKKDRRALRLKLFQIQELLVRAEHDQLTDREYGRSLYLLNKEYDQATNNVPSHERSAFIDDLAYLAQTHPSVTQKKETVAIMWGKYSALAMPT